MMRNKSDAMFSYCGPYTLAADLLQGVTRSTPHFSQTTRITSCVYIYTTHRHYVIFVGQRIDDAQKHGRPVRA